MKRRGLGGKMIPELVIECITGLWGQQVKYHRHKIRTMSFNMLKLYCRYIWLYMYKKTTVTGCLIISKAPKTFL